MRFPSFSLERSGRYGPIKSEVMMKKIIFILLILITFIPGFAIAQPFLEWDQENPEEVATYQLYQVGNLNMLGTFEMSQVVPGIQRQFRIDLAPFVPNILDGNVQLQLKSCGNDFWGEGVQCSDVQDPSNAVPKGAPLPATNGTILGQ